MKKVIYCLLGSFFFLSTSAFNCAGESPRKIALIIAVGNYPQNTGWQTISSLSDTFLIKNSLLKQGFLEKDITVLIDKQADKDGIVSALKGLAGRANPGDIVFLHYSGHGQQIQDIPPYDEIDGYDEALIPINACLYYKSDSSHGKNHLRDDELGALINGVRAKIGPRGDLMVVLDACHSGTGTRGVGKSRGTAVVFEAPGYQPGSHNATGEEKGFDEMANSADLSPCVIFSASSANELNYEYTTPDAGSYGSLSFAFSKAFENVSKDMTYRGLFDEIRAEMAIIAPRQSPQVEGDIDRKVMGGRAEVPKPYYMVKQWNDTTSVKLNAGQLLGIYDSSLVAFYPIGTIDPSKSTPRSTGYVKNATMVDCDVDLLQPLNEPDARKSWVFMKVQKLGNPKVRVKLDNSLSEAIKDGFIKDFENSALVEISVQIPEIVIEEIPAVTKDSLQAYTSSDEILYKKKLDLQKSEEMVRYAAENIRNYARAKFIKKIEQKNADLDIRFELIPVKMKPGAAGVVEQMLPVSTKMNKEQMIDFKEGDYFIFKFKNYGNEIAYFNVIDIQPDNIINIIVPIGDKKAAQLTTAAECVLNPGDSMVVIKQPFRIGPPYGKETLLLVSSPEALNLDFITSGGIRGTKGSGPATPFETLFAESQKERKTRGPAPEIPPATVNINTLQFMISSRK